MAPTRTTEIRHIPQAELVKLGEILNQPLTSPAWKKLMGSVPNELTHRENLSDCKPKYKMQDILLIEKAGGNDAAYKFLEEWNTSGQIRPTLSHLLQLLVKSELFRAADYVAIDLLGEAAPPRPTKGPAAKIDISLSEDEIVDGLANGNYPNTSDIEELNRFHEAASKNIASKKLFVRTSDRPAEEEDGFSPRPEYHGSQQQMLHANGLPQHRINHTTSTMSENKSSSSSRTTNESVIRSLSTPHSPHNFLPNFEMMNGQSNYSNTGSAIQLSSAQSSRTADSPHNFVPNFEMINSQYYHNSHMQPNLSIFNMADGSVSSTGQQAMNVSRILIDPSRSSSGRSTPIIYSTDKQHYSNENVPLLSELMPPNQSDRSTSASQGNLHSQNIDFDLPNVSMLNIANENNNDQTTKQSESYSGNVPHLIQSVDNQRPGLNSSDQQDNGNGNCPHLSFLMHSSHSTPE